MYYGLLRLTDMRGCQVRLSTSQKTHLQSGFAIPAPAPSMMSIPFKGHHLSPRYPVREFASNLSYALSIVGSREALLVR